MHDDVQMSRVYLDQVRYLVLKLTGVYHRLLQLGALTTDLARFLEVP